MTVLFPTSGLKSGTRQYARPLLYQNDPRYAVIFAANDCNSRRLYPRDWHRDGCARALQGLEREVAGGMVEITQLYRYPIAGLSAQPISILNFSKADGVAHDRSYALALGTT
ncbi:MAG TPA: hypothetical protein VL752_00245 [Acidisoma sp.]|jgi:hypothetical protein|uniref:hypothetical protein n=1 Tax=Acidisoma sp. TaxID=1872115 RepID=UPI002CA4D69B|nr:hypothetical protein [Acidisoma sp.]HTH99345.1 hypothetical protein [Acidisoma sp.]